MAITGTKLLTLQGFLKFGTYASGTSVKTFQYLAVIKSGPAINASKNVARRYLIKNASGEVSALGIKNSKLQYLIKNASGEVSALGIKNSKLQYFAKAMQGATEGTANKLAQYLSKSMLGVAGTIGTGAKTLQLLRAPKTGFVPAIGVEYKTIQLFEKRASGIAGVVQTVVTVTMNTQRQALSAYTNFSFDSFCILNGAVLGVNSTGLYVLSGDNDNGAATPINAVAVGGISDFGTAKIKKVDFLYMGYISDGVMQLNVTTDELRTRAYKIPATGLQGINVSRVRLGKGIVARYWQFGVQNVNGSDFTVDNMEFKPTILNRRIGGHA